MTNFERNKLISNCHKNGKTQIEIGEIFSLSQSAVSQIIIHLKNVKSENKIETRGAKSKLNDENVEELKKILTDSPQDYGYFMWNKWSVKSLLLDKFEVEYHENYIWKIMKCISFSSQKPQKKDYRQNEKLVTAFKEEKASEIKKKQN